MWWKRSVPRLDQASHVVLSDDGLVGAGDPLSSAKML